MTTKGDPDFPRWREVLGDITPEPAPPPAAPTVGVAVSQIRPRSPAIDAAIQAIDARTIPPVTPRGGPVPGSDSASWLDLVPHAPATTEPTLQPGAPPHDAHAPLGQGIPGVRVTPSPEEPRPTMRGSGPGGAPKNSVRFLTVNCGVSGHPSYHGPLRPVEPIAKDDGPPPDQAPTLRPPATDYKPVIQAFRAEVREANLAPPEHLPEEEEALPVFALVAPKVPRDLLVPETEPTPDTPAPPVTTSLNTPTPQPAIPDRPRRTASKPRRFAQALSWFLNQPPAPRIFIGANLTFCLYLLTVLVHQIATNWWYYAPF